MMRVVGGCKETSTKKNWMFFSKFIGIRLKYEQDFCQQSRFPTYFLIWAIIFFFFAIFRRQSGFCIYSFLF